jgi:transposase
MKQIRVLSEHELITLEEAFKNHPKHRCRIRAHAIINSYHGFSIKQIAQILLVKGETVSSWLDQWFEHGIVFLYDSKRTGRPTIYNSVENQRLKKLVDKEPYQLKQAQSIIILETGKTASKSTLKRILKKI